MNTFDRPPTQHTLRAFSSCLLALGDVTHGAGVDQIVEEAMRTFQPLVRFDRAWWGQVTSPQDEARNWLQGHIGLAPQFGEEWNRIAPRDEFGNSSRHALGRVIRSADEDDDGPIPGDILDFCVRWELRHAMAITVELPGSGQLFFVSLYRGLDRPPFDDDEAGLFHEFTAHLLQGWRHRLAAVRERIAQPAWDSFAVADTHGRLLYLGRRAAAELKRAFPGWAGWALPAELAAVSQPQAPARVPASLTVQRVGTLTAIACTRRSARRAGLAPSQWNAAMLYAQGQPYTAIAQRLQLSPATVRTYLRDAYAQLGVRNKIELLAALQGGVRRTDR